METIIVENIMKVIDINPSMLAPETINYMQDCLGATYLDVKLKEHLFDVTDWQDRYQYGELEEPSPVVCNDLDKLVELCGNNDAAYVRIIFI